MAVFCTSCGTNLPDGARFCSSCGAAIYGAPAPARPTVRPLAGRMIAGVCIGLSQAHGWDVTTVRILAVLACIFTGGTVAVAYIACWIGIPEEQYPVAYPAPGAYTPPSPPPSA